MKRGMPRVMRTAVVLTGVAMLAACAGGAPRENGAAAVTSTSPATRGSPVYKIGKPYQVNGVWYYPREDFGYDETGLASWYGPDFHGKYTADGEIFDQNAVSAAHKTLPLPSLVRVTNLENGRSVVVRVNDRGPFVNGRIIDLSRRAAQLLGMEAQGTAKVRVQILADESRALAMGIKPDNPGNEPMVEAAPRASVTAESLPPPNGRVDRSDQAASSPPPPPPPPPPSPMEQRMAAATAAANREVGQVSQVPVPASTAIYVQAGAFARYDNALRLSAHLSGIGHAVIQQAQVRGQTVFRVRMGPMPSVEEADRILQQVISAGQQDARVVVD